MISLWHVQRSPVNSEYSGCEDGGRSRAKMPLDGDSGTKIAQENWQWTFAASQWPVSFKISVERIISKRLVRTVSPAVFPSVRPLIPSTGDAALFQSDIVYWRWRGMCTQHKLMRCLRIQCTAAFWISAGLIKKHRWDSACSVHKQIYCPRNTFQTNFSLFIFGGGGQVHCGCGADSSESALTANKTQGAVLIWWTRLTAEIVEGTFWKNIK